MIKSTAQNSLAQGSDWRFLNEIKYEVKGRGGGPPSDAEEVP